MDAAMLDSLAVEEHRMAGPAGDIISGEGVLVDVLGSHPAGVRTTREQLTQLLHAELGRLDPITGNVLNMDVTGMANMLLRDALLRHSGVTAKTPIRRRVAFQRCGGQFL